MKSLILVLTLFCFSLFSALVHAESIDYNKIDFWENNPEVLKNDIYTIKLGKGFCGGEILSEEQINANVQALSKQIDIVYSVLKNNAGATGIDISRLFPLELYLSIDAAQGCINAASYGKKIYVAGMVDLSLAGVWSELLFHELGHSYEFTFHHESTDRAFMESFADLFYLQFNNSHGFSPTLAKINFKRYSDILKDLGSLPEAEYIAKYRIPSHEAYKFVQATAPSLIMGFTEEYRRDFRTEVTIEDYLKVPDVYALSQLINFHLRKSESQKDLFKILTSHPEILQINTPISFLRMYVPDALKNRVIRDRSSGFSELLHISEVKTGEFSTEFKNVPDDIKDKQIGAMVLYFEEPKSKNRLLSEGRYLIRPKLGLSIATVNSCQERGSSAYCVCSDVELTLKPRVDYLDNKGSIVEGLQVAAPLSRPKGCYLINLRDEPKL